MYTTSRSVPKPRVARRRDPSQSEDHFQRRARFLPFHLWSQRLQRLRGESGSDVDVQRVREGDRRRERSSAPFLRRRLVRDCNRELHLLLQRDYRLAACLRDWDDLPPFHYSHSVEGGGVRSQLRFRRRRETSLRNERGILLRRYSGGAVQRHDRLPKQHGSRVSFPTSFPALSSSFSSYQPSPSLPSS